MKNIFAFFAISFGIQNFSYAGDIQIYSYPGHREVAFCQSQPTGFYGFKNGSKGLSLTSVEFAKQKINEEMIAIDLTIEDEKPESCWVLKTKIDFPIFVKGLKVAHSPVIMSGFHGKLSPGDNKTVSVGTQKFNLQFPRASTANYTCVLGETENLDLDGGGYEILLAADLNNDQLPDFIVQNARKYSFQQYQILMSDKASKKCKAVATRESYSC